MQPESQDNAAPYRPVPPTPTPTPADFLFSIVCGANSLGVHGCSNFLWGTPGEIVWLVTSSKNVLLFSTLSSFSMESFCPLPQMSGLMGSADCLLLH